MLLDNQLEISWNNATKKWYMDKGYKFTKIRDVFIVELKDLIPTSTIKVNVKCDFCGEIHKKEYRKFFTGRNIIEKDCCKNKKCVALKTKEIHMKLYKVENTMQRPEIKEKSAKHNRMSFVEVMELCENKGLILLTAEKEYVNTKSSIKIICKKHIIKGTQTTNVSNIKSLKHCCYYGGMEAVGASKKLNISIIKNKFIELDYTPMFNECDYKSNQVKLPFICNKHTSEGVQYVSYSNIQQGQRGCKFCSMESLKDKLKLDEKYVFDEFNKKGLIVLEGEQYFNKEKHIKYLCSKHQQMVQQISFSALKRTETPCDMCRLEASNHILNRKIRPYLSTWKEDTRKKYNYSCALTGSNIYDVHHIHSFSFILEEALRNLGFKSDERNGYNLELIKNEVLKLHDIYGLGVCIHPRLHSILHSEFGKETNLADYENFKQNYINGKYNELIKDIIEKPRM